MNRKQKINVLKHDIQSYEFVPNGSCFYPLPEKLIELQKVFNVDISEKREFIDYINETPIAALTWCLSQCKEGYKGQELENTIIMIKRRALKAIDNFFVGCKVFDQNNLLY